jgi:exodeoxyribonuclease X
MIIHVLDTETTGLEPETHRVIELAAVELVEVEPGSWKIGDGRDSLVNPHREISFEAMGVHHIQNKDVAEAPDLDEAIERVLSPTWRETVDIVAGHNCRFDRDMLAPLRDKRWLDTYRCAMHVWPDAPNFKNGTLFYWSGCTDAGVPRAHSSLFDAHMTAHILIKLLSLRSVDDLLRLSTKACVLKKVGFGKHFGKLWTEVDFGYLEWAAKNITDDPDVKFTVRTEIDRRQSGRR